MYKKIKAAVGNSHTIWGRDHGNEHDPNLFGETLIQIKQIGRG